MGVNPLRSREILHGKFRPPNSRLSAPSPPAAPPGGEPRQRAPYRSQVNQ